MSTTEFKNLMPWAFGLLAGLTAATVIISIAYSQGYDSFARGLTQGAVIGAVAIAVLWFLGRRAGGMGRLATGEGDERDDLLSLKASSDTSVGMFAAALGGIIAGMYGMPAPMVGALVLWAGLVVWIASYAWRSRQG